MGGCFDPEKAKCIDAECGYIDVIHHQHRSRHYENGNISGTWYHHPLSDGSIGPFTGSNGRQTNFYEFSGHGKDSIFDEAGQGYWKTVAWVIGQHPIGFMEEMLSELEIELTPDEAKLIGDCDMLLYYISEQVWEHNIVPSGDYTPTLHCVLTNAGKGTLVKTLWSVAMNEDGYQWRSGQTVYSCDPQLPQDRKCIWRVPRDDNQIFDYPNYGSYYLPSGRVYLLQAMQPSGGEDGRVAFLGPPAGKCAAGIDGWAEEPVVFGHIVQIRSTYTGELLFDGMVESEAALSAHLVFEGCETTCGSDWCSPEPNPDCLDPEPIETEIETFYVPTGLHWGIPFGDTSMLACMSVAGNRNDLEQFDEGDNTLGDSLWYSYGGLRLVTLHQADDNDFILRESNRSPVGFVPNTAPPTPSPDGLLWAAAYEYDPAIIDPTDPEFIISYGIYEVGMGSVSAPIKVDRFDGMVGTPTTWCETLYTLSSGQTRYDPETDSSEVLFGTKRATEAGADLPEALSENLSFGVGYWGWELLFWDAAYFNDWNSRFWPSLGVGYHGWSVGWGPLAFYMYVVGDYTPGGDLDKITFRPPVSGEGTLQIEENPCRETCHDNTTIGDDDGCGGCDCENVELEIDIGDPDCYGTIPITVTCVGCNSRNENEPHHFQWNTDNIAYSEGGCISLGPSNWRDGICGGTFFIQAGEAGAIEFRYGRCGCGFYTCLPLPSWECPLSVSDPSVVDPGAEPAELPDDCSSGLVTDCYDNECNLSSTARRYYKVTVEVLCDDPPTPEVSLEWTTGGDSQAHWCGDGGEGILIQESATVWSYYKCGSWSQGHNDLACGAGAGFDYVALTVNVRLPDICSYTSTYVYVDSEP